MVETHTCGKCGERPPGKGGILCPVCRVKIEQQPAPWQLSDQESDATLATAEQTASGKSQPPVAAAQDRASDALVGDSLPSDVTQ